MKNISNSFHSGRAIFFLMVFICCILAGAVLKIASSVILPFTIAILLAFVMYPVMKWLDKFRCPRALSVSLVIIIMIAFLYGFGTVIFMSGRMIVAQYPKYESRFTEIYIWMTRFFDLSYDESMTFFENLWDQLEIRTFVRNSTLSFSTTFLNFIQNAVLVVIFVAFLLVEASYFKEKLETAFDDHFNRFGRMGRDLILQVSRYLTAKFYISLVTGLVVGIGFHLVGLEFAVVWGILQFLLNFIPILGSIVAGFSTSLFALVQFWPEPVPVILVVAVTLGANMIIGNILDPKIIGDHVGISPLIVMVSLLIWGWIWGFAGMLLSVPMVVIIKIVCENIPILEPVSILLGSRRSVKAKKTVIEKNET
jgi:predicted PurR-regulated permease PerM